MSLKFFLSEWLLEGIFNPFAESYTCLLRLCMAIGDSVLVFSKKP